MRILAKILAGLVLAILAYIALDGAMTAMQAPLKMRGQMVDIGGRRLHLICEGSKGASPTVVFEAGAFGFSADGAVVQDKLAAKGFRACNYDRAGLGLSDPGPEPRNGVAIVGDLEKLLAAAHEPGPYILVGHSMAGLYLQLFANRNPAKTAGLVYVDATTPEVTATPAGQRFVRAYIRASRLAALGAEMGLYQPLVHTWFGDKIGLSPAAKAEKGRAFASPKHNRWASAEVDQWFVSAEQARASGPLDPNLPIAVVVPAQRLDGDGGALRLQPATRSKHGDVEAVGGAGHATLIGLRYADAIVRAVEAVRAAGHGGAA